MSDQNENEIDSIAAASTLAATKFDQNQWNAIEKNVSPFEDQVISALIQTGVTYARGNASKSSVRTKQKYCLGEEFDEELFKGLVKLKLCPRLQRTVSVTETDSKKKKNVWNGNKKKGSKGASRKVEQMRRQNATRRANESIESILSTYDMKKITPRVGFSSDIIELVGATFCYVMAYMIRGKSKFEEERYFESLMSIIVSAQRFLNTCSDYVGMDMVTPGRECKISQNIIRAIQASCDQFYETYPFDGMKICRDLPALLIRSTYDKYIPKLSVTPYDHQVDILDALHNNMQSSEFDGLLCVYSAMLASGKTTTIVALGAYVQHIRLTYPKYSNLQLMFICNLESVKTQVANLCYNASKQGFCKFAVAYMMDNDTYRIVNHWSTNDDNRSVIICDPGTAHKILSDRSQDGELGPVEDRFIKFHDEHTIGADIEGSLPLKQNVECMMTPTRWTILSSATSPKIEDLPKIIARTEEVVGKVEISTVHSDTVFIGINVMTDSREPVMPYQNCENGSALKSSIAQIREIPFLGRMLTSNVAVNLYEHIKALSSDPTNQIDFSEFPDIPTRFKNVDNMKADAVKSTVLEMLEFISDLDDRVVLSICKSSVLPISTDQDQKADSDSNSESDSESDSDSEGGFVFEDEDDEDVQAPNPNEPFDFHTLGTTGAHEFDVQTLIAVNNPVDWGLEHFAPLLDILHEKGCKSVIKLLASYAKRKKEHDSKVEKIVRNIDNEDVLSKRLQEMEEQGPKLEFPSFGHIGSRSHASKFCEGKEYENFRNHLNIDAYITRIDEIMIPDNILMLLLCGVGIYEPTSKVLDKPYLTLVLELAAEGKLAYMVADNSITFGTNYPFGKLVVGEDFSDAHSVYTLFQLLGRSGRVGMSWKAEAMISTSMAAKIVDFTVNPDKYTIESENIDLMVDQIKTEQEDEEQKAMAELELEIMKSLEADKPQEPQQIIVINPGNRSDTKTDAETDDEADDETDDGTDDESDTKKTSKPSPFEGWTRAQSKSEKKNWKRDERRDERHEKRDNHRNDMQFNRFERAKTKDESERESDRNTNWRRTDRRNESNERERDTSRDTNWHRNNGRDERKDGSGQKKYVPPSTRRGNGERNDRRDYDRSTNWRSGDRSNGSGDNGSVRFERSGRGNDRSDNRSNRGRADRDNNWRR